MANTKSQQGLKVEGDQPSDTPQDPIDGADAPGSQEKPAMGEGTEPAPGE